MLSNTDFRVERNPHGANASSEICDTRRIARRIAVPLQRAAGGTSDAVAPVGALSSSVLDPTETRGRRRILLLQTIN
jgi:hypothetical protein